MRQKRILGISRATTFSPHREDADARIFNATANALIELGYAVDTCSEESLPTLHQPLDQPLVQLIGRPFDKPIDKLIDKPLDGIFHMARSEAALQWLAAQEAHGTRVVNTAEAVHHCSRRPSVTCLQEAQVPIAPSEILPTHGPLPQRSYPLWLKRADGQTTHRNDVCHAANAGECASLLATFKERGIDTVVASTHLAGDLVKFYAVSGGFFYWCYPDIASKFGLEQYNGAPRGIAFSADALHAIAHKAGQALGIEVFGGDAIISPSGAIHLIDLNDWPSFAPCLAEAAQAIATRIHQHLTHQQ